MRTAQQPDVDEATESDDENSDDDTASITSNDDAVATAARA